MLNIMDTVILLNLNSQVALNQFFCKAVGINFLKKSMCKRSIRKVFYFSQCLISRLRLKDFLTTMMLYYNF